MKLHKSFKELLKRHFQNSSLMRLYLSELLGDKMSNKQFYLNIGRIIGALDFSRGMYSDKKSSNLNLRLDKALMLMLKSDNNLELLFDFLYDNSNAMEAKKILSEKLNECLNIN